jgi:hypothetical protein
VGPRDLAARARILDRPIKKLPTLRGRTVVNLFFEDAPCSVLRGLDPGPDLV